MTVEDISWSVSTKECCQTMRGSNPRPSDHQSDSHPSRKHAYIILTPLKHAYIILTPLNLGFTGVYIIIFHISALNIDCENSLEPPHRGGSNEYPQSMFWGEIWKISESFIRKFSFLEVNFSVYLNRRVFVIHTYELQLCAPVLVWVQSETLTCLGENNIFRHSEIIIIIIFILSFYIL